MNLFTSENLQKYKISSSSGHGEWSKHNGENAILLNPARFYANSAAVQVLKNEFVPNTQYVVNIYMDVDNITNSTTGANASEGIRVHYTDGESQTLYKTGNKDNPKGWQNHFYITDGSKSVSHIAIYYNIGKSIPFRWDSYIGPLQTNQVEQSGLFNIGTLNNNYNNNTASIQNGGIIYADNFYEF